MSDFYPHLERRKQQEQPRHRLLWVLVIVVPALVLSLLGPPIGRLAHHIAADYELADAAAQAQATRDDIAPKVGLDDPFSNRRTLPQLRGRPNRQVAGPAWTDDSKARIVDEPDIGFAFRIDSRWICRVTPDSDGVNAKCFGPKVDSVLRLRIVPCPGECGTEARRQLDDSTTRGLTGDPVELRRHDDRTRFTETAAGDRYVLIATHVYSPGKGQRMHLTLMSEGPPSERTQMQMAINDALTQAG